MFGIAKEAHEFHGNIAVKLEFYLDKVDYGYDQTYVSVPDFTGATYKGKLDKDGQPRDPLDYQAWEDKLPRKWHLNPFHNHFIYLPPDYTKADVEREITYHLPNFYAAWAAGKTMRSGWATEKRVRPVRFDKAHPFDYEARKIACLDKIATIHPVSLTVDSLGRTYPATDIDVGSAAIDRATNYNLGGQTLVTYTNPANASGTLDTIEIWALSSYNLANTKVGTFSGSGTDWDDRDYETIGTVTSGSKQTFTGLSIDVSTDDVLGAYCTSGRIEMASTGGSGHGYKNGDYFGSGTTTYTNQSDRIHSLYGTGETASVGARLLALTGVGK